MLTKADGYVLIACGLVGVTASALFVAAYIRMLRAIIREQEALIGERARTVALLREANEASEGLSNARAEMIEIQKGSIAVLNDAIKTGSGLLRIYDPQAADSLLKTRIEVQNVKAS